MKKWMNTLFFGSCFIAAMLIEAYSIKILNGSFVIATGLGVVVLLTGYLFMDSLRSNIQKGSQEAKLYIDQRLKEETDRWNERYMELLNIQKASYTATKKNTALVTKRFDEVLFKIDILEDINAKAQQKIMDLQRKALEGQKKALNLEINYGRENVDHIIEVLKEEARNNDVGEQLNNVLKLLEINTELLKDNKILLNAVDNNLTHVQPAKAASLWTEDKREEFSGTTDTELTTDFIEDEVDSKDLNPTGYDFNMNTFNDNYIITDTHGDIKLEENLFPENLDVTDDMVSDSLKDYLKSDNLNGSEENFQSGFNEDQDMIDQSMDNYSTVDQNLIDQDIVDQNTIDQNWINQIIAEQNIAEQNLLNQNILDQNILDQSTQGQNVIDQNTLDELLKDISIDQEDLNPIMNGINDDFDTDIIMNNILPDENNTSVPDLSYSEEPESEVLDSIEDIEEQEKPKVVPLYDDPNKALTADEIAALFASFGQ